MHVDTEFSLPEGPKHLPAGRKAQIVAYVNSVDEVTVASLASEFGVSQYTIRRDLDELDRLGFLIRTYGGAVSALSTAVPDSGFDIRVRTQARSKDRIGYLASRLVVDNTAIIINSGTTTLAMVRHLKDHRDLTVTTNNLRLPMEIDERTCRELHVLGGQARLISQATLGPVSLRIQDPDDIDIWCHTAFIGVGALSSSFGYSTSNPREAAMMAEMMERAQRVVVLADATKFNVELFAKIGPLSVADVLVTEEVPPAALADALADSGVEVITGEPTSS